MEEFKIQQAFNAFVGDKLWEPHNKTARASIFSGTTGSGVLVNFDEQDGEAILPMPLQQFLEINNLKECDFYNPESV
jgi:hypothetical protein